MSRKRSRHRAGALVVLVALALALPSSSPAAPAWLAPQDLSAPGQSGSQPQVALDAAGNAVAVWERSNGTNVIVQAATRPAGGSWGAPQDLSAPGQNASDPQVALDAAGNAVAVWFRGSVTNVIVQAATRPAGGSWSAPQDVSAAGQCARAPQVALNAAGNAVAVWYCQGNLVHGATRPAGGSWSAPQDLSAPGGSVSVPQVALDPAGNAVAVWERFNGTNSIVQAAGYDAAGPVFAGLSIPTSGRAGTALSFSVSPFDVWSALGPGPLWSFGDGGSGAGATTSHTYSAAGSYTVMVSQADVLGNQTTASTAIAIGAAPSPPKPKCVVPKVTGKTLAKAKAAIKKRHCRTGKVTRAYSKRAKKGRVLSQKPKAGRKLANGAKVNLVLSRGKRR